MLIFPTVNVGAHITVSDDEKGGAILALHACKANHAPVNTGLHQQALTATMISVAGQRVAMPLDKPLKLINPLRL